MKRIYTTTIAAATMVLLTASAANAQSSRRSASRVDFDDQLIQGQVNRGAVHLIERKDSDLGSLVKTRQSFRKEILAGTAVETIATESKEAIAAPDFAIPADLPVVKPSAEVRTNPGSVKATKKKSKAKPASKSQQISKAGGPRAISRR